MADLSKGALDEDDGDDEAAGTMTDALFARHARTTELYPDPTKPARAVPRCDCAVGFMQARGVLTRLCSSCVGSSLLSRLGISHSRRRRLPSAARGLGAELTGRRSV